MLTLSCYWKRILWMIYLSFFSPLALTAAEADDRNLAVCDLIMSAGGTKKEQNQCTPVTTANTPLEFQCSICLGQDKTPSPDADILNLLFEVVDPAQVVKIIRCQHHFHRRCLLRWLQLSGSCPLCRAVISQGNK